MRYILGGAAIRSASSIAGTAIASSGIPMANTLGMMASSFANSLGMNAITNGAIPISMNFGMASYDFSNGDWGFLGEKGNSFLENVGYGMGAMANVADILAGFNPKTATLATENDPDWMPSKGKGDKIGHSQLAIGNEVVIDWGPDPSANPFSLVKGTNKFKKDKLTTNLKGSRFWDNQSVFGVNEGSIRSYGNLLNKGGKYQMFFNSCVSQTSRALNISGAFNIGIHPYLLHTQMYLRNVGARPLLFLHHIHSNGIRNK